MYLALFLMPWVLVYAISTIVMNHHEKPGKEDAAPEVPWILEAEIMLPRSVTNPKQVLAAVNMDGPHKVNTPSADGSINIDRHDAFRPRRLIWSPGLRTVRIERQPFLAGAFTERLHKRRNFGSGYLGGNLWAATVDLTVLSIIFWAASGVWLWFELRALRRWGLIFFAIGAALFAFFTVTI